MTKEDYCEKCDCTGYMFNGELCDCVYGKQMAEKVRQKIEKENAEDELRKGIIPSQYGEEFNAEFLPEEYVDTLGEDLEEIQNYIKTNKCIPRNILICSQPNTGKTIFQYSIISWAIQNNIPYCKPMFISDISNMINDRNQIQTLSKIMSTPILFVTIDEAVVLGFAQVMQTIVDKRTNIGLSTMFFSRSDFEILINKPTGGLLKVLQGDGLFKSIEIKNYYKRKEEI